MKKTKNKWSLSAKGFSLVELIIAIGIASLIMMGMSVFFSSSLKNNLEAQDRIHTAQKQFVTDSIIREKFFDIRQVVNIAEFSNGKTTGHLIALNKSHANAAPFSYIGKIIEGDKRSLVFKDWLSFVKVGQVQGITAHLYSSPGEGIIKDGNTHNAKLRQIPKNFAGFTKMDGKFYIALPDQNKIIICNQSPTNCSPQDLDLRNSDISLKWPMDLATDDTGEVLFISDAGSGRILKYEDRKGMSILAEGLKFPTGLAYYKQGNDAFLLVAETMNDVIRRIDLNDPSRIEIITGLGEDETCEGSAPYCKLSNPTGIFVLQSRFKNELFIADSGNDRILKIKDAGKPETLNIKFETGLEARPINKLKLIFPPQINITNATIDPNTIASTNNALSTHGTVKISGNNLEYQLFTELAEDTTVTNACKKSICPKNKIRVNNGPLLYAPFNKIKLGGDANNPFSATKKGGFIFSLSPNPDRDHVAGTEVSLSNNIPVETEISFTISDINTNQVTEAHPLVTIEAYDASEEVIFTRYQSLRVGDGLLGTADDIIEIIGGNDGGPGKNTPYIIDFSGQLKTLKNPIHFPTGVSNVLFTNTGQSKVVHQNSQAEIPIQIISNDTIETWDYKSTFELDDDSDGLKFSVLNNGKLLEMLMGIKADENTVKTTHLNIKLD